MSEVTTKDATGAKELTAAVAGGAATGTYEKTVPRVGDTYRRPDVTVIVRDVTDFMVQWEVQENGESRFMSSSREEFDRRRHWTFVYAKTEFVPAEAEEKEVQS